jgi:glycosyltransferase involved in cell wall biosynthesis
MKRESNISIDICMPTKQSAKVLDLTLDRLATSIDQSPIRVNKYVVVDDSSTDKTLSIANRHADRNNWTIEIESGNYPLQEARRICIDYVESDWFLFLDDDVLISNDYLTTLAAAMGPVVGGIQGRKGQGNSNSKWVRWQSHRAGTHATLIRTKAVEGITFPDDLSVLEDEYIRQHIENNSYIWVFNHQSRFDHRNQARHPISWKEGYLAGKYGLSSFCFYARKIPASVVDHKNPLPHIKRTSGWIWGWITDE